MRGKGQIIFGLVILLVGLALLIDNLFHISIWSFFWPLTIIALGVWMILRPRGVSRPRGVGSGVRVWQRLLGDVRRRGDWQVTDEEFWHLIGDVRLDMTEAQIPEGETTIRIYGLVGSLRLVVPEGVGVSVVSTAFVTDARVFGQKTDNVLSPYKYQSEDYSTAERRIRIESSRFIADLRVNRAEQT